jgi:bacterioferritin-associated ferredoxin
VIVCSCNVLTDCQIRATVEAQAGGARTPGQVYRCLGCSPQCGRCARTIKSILDVALGNCEAANAGCAGCAGCPAHVGESHAAIEIAAQVERLLGDLAPEPLHAG